MPTAESSSVYHGRLCYGCRYDVTVLPARLPHSGSVCAPQSGREQLRRAFADTVRILPDQPRDQPGETRAAGRRGQGLYGLDRKGDAHPHARDHLQTAAGARHQLRRVRYRIRARAPLPPQTIVGRAQTIGRRPVTDLTLYAIERGAREPARHGRSLSRGTAARTRGAHRRICRQQIAKVDRIGRVLSSLDAVQSHAKSEIERLRAQPKSAENNAERLKASSCTFSRSGTASRSRAIT